MFTKIDKWYIDKSSYFWQSQNRLEHISHKNVNKKETNFIIRSSNQKVFLTNSSFAYNAVFEASSVIGTCNRFAKYLDTWARQSDAMKQKIIAFLSNPLDPSITYQDIDQMPLAAFAVANVSKESFTEYCVTRMVSHTCIKTVWFGWFLTEISVAWCSKACNRQTEVVHTNENHDEQWLWSSEHAQRTQLYGPVFGTLKLTSLKAR